MVTGTVRRTVLRIIKDKKTVKATFREEYWTKWIYRFAIEDFEAMRRDVRYIEGQIKLAKGQPRVVKQLERLLAHKKRDIALLERIIVAARQIFRDERLVIRVEKRAAA